MVSFFANNRSLFNLRVAFLLCLGVCGKGCSFFWMWWDFGVLLHRSLHRLGRSLLLCVKDYLVDSQVRRGWHSTTAVGQIQTMPRGDIFEKGFGIKFCIRWISV